MLVGELRSLNSTRDDMLKTIITATEDAVIVVLIESHTTQNTRVMWTSAAPRVFAYFSMLLTNFDLSFIRRVDEKTEQ